MRVHFDEKADAVYVKLDDSPVVGSEEVQPGVILDYDAKGFRPPLSQAGPNASPAGGP